MGRAASALIAAVLMLATAACGSTTLSAARPSPSPSASPSVATSPSASPSVVPTASPAPDYGPPPAGVDLFYVQWPAAPTWLIGYDWSGKPRATVHLKELDAGVDTIGSGINVAPNGTAFADGGGSMTFDRLGNLIYQTAPREKGNLISTWSDEGRLLCGVEEAMSTIDSNGNGTVDYYLTVRPLNGPPVRVKKFLHLDFVPGDMGYSLAACSGTLNRALLVRTVCCSIQGAVVLRLTDGALLGSWNRTGGQPIFSPDGQEIADPTWTANGNTASTEVRLILGGTVLARYGPGVVFEAFSGDNRLAVIKSGSQTQVIQVNSRRVIWRDTTGRTLARAVARPGTGDMVLAFTIKDQVDSIVVVHADGSSAAIDGQFLVPMSWGY